MDALHDQAVDSDVLAREELPGGKFGFRPFGGDDKTVLLKANAAQLRAGRAGGQRSEIQLQAG
ncbi:MAG TPA: hypothetical protein VK477_07625, partial [Acidobacteriota bacterium]|nr:hypothetical protein [Acidobacteriota bacterium]